MIAKRRSGLALMAAALALLIGTPCRCLASAMPSAVAAMHSCCPNGGEHTSQPTANAPAGERHRSCDHCSAALSRSSGFAIGAAPQVLDAADVVAPLSHTPVVAIGRFDHPPPPARLVTQRFLVFRTLLL